MASASGNGSSTDDHADDADLAKVWAELSKGEKTAQALESNLTSLEKKIDDLLASFEESEREKLDQANSKRPSSSTGADGKS
ncbi:hypothetical protein LSUE1_G004318 [Lachnellula suecica]|uniref:Uncharacterized protein n=1 Tax=Lachnellula suecica TaxID=602035 RepID=A0A8T9C4E1_9HELO|nr:hypothetical protein LSUE1_G004318 [Lachnellula suecica]